MEAGQAELGRMEKKKRTEKGMKVQMSAWSGPARRPAKLGRSVKQGKRKEEEHPVKKRLAARRLLLEVTIAQ